MNKSEVIEMASKMTREEFLYENAKYNGSCPHILSPQQEECNVVSDEDAKECCVDCWGNALNKDSDIKFKDEEIIEQPKEYTIHNIINDFEEGIVFEYMERRYKIYCGGLYCWNTKCETPMWKTSILTLKEIVNMKFTRSEQLKPMTFEKASKTGKNVRYECPTKIQDKFYPLNVTIQSIGESCDSEAITNIILKGTWFAEGVYE